MPLNKSAFLIGRATYGAHLVLHDLATLKMLGALGKSWLVCYPNSITSINVTAQFEAKFHNLTPHMHEPSVSK
jgi:hypothetical protein